MIISLILSSAAFSAEYARSVYERKQRLDEEFRQIKVNAVDRLLLTSSAELGLGILSGAMAIQRRESGSTSQKKKPRNLAPRRLLFWGWGSAT